MTLFNMKLFSYTFGITLSITFAVALAIVVTQDALSVLSVTVAVLASLAISATIAAPIAGYRLPVRCVNGIYRKVMRRQAKRAIRESLSNATTRVECSGILEIDVRVALRVRAGLTAGVSEGTQFNVYESTNNQLWGSVVAINVREADCDCIVSDRANVEFWEKLEDRMRYNTEKPPNIHLVRELPIAYLLEQVESLLDAWR